MTYINNEYCGCEDNLVGHIFTEERNNVRLFEYDKPQILTQLDIEYH